MSVRDTRGHHHRRRCRDGHRDPRHRPHRRRRGQGQVAARAGGSR
nr:hypothetical protein [Janibacter limosus]